MGKSSKTVVIAARVTPDLDRLIRTLAVTRHCTSTDIIIRALLFYFENVKKVIGINET